MSGHYSRRKGLRNEYLLRDQIRKEGYEADRVPASGASQGFKGDVRFRKNGFEGTVEVKSRKVTFAALYELFKEAKDGAMGLAIGTPENLLCASVTDSLDKAYDHRLVYVPSERFTAQKGIRKLVSIQEMLQSSDVLAVRDDAKPFLFVRYR